MARADFSPPVGIGQSGPRVSMYLRWKPMFKSDNQLYQAWADATLEQLTETTTPPAATSIFTFSYFQRGRLGCG
jgi:hypothetical protein